MSYIIPKTKYLGIEFDPLKPYSYDFKNLLEKIKSKTGNSNCRFISQVGRITLIKSNLQSIPTYTLQTKILKSLNVHPWIKSTKIFYGGLWSLKGCSWSLKQEEKCFQK